MTGRVEKAILIHGDDGIDTYPFGIDFIHKASVSITSEHHEIHEGNHFYIEGYLSLDQNASTYFKINVPQNNKYAHMVWVIGSSGVLTYNLYEDAIGGMTGGVSATPLNSNRNNTATSILRITKNVTVASDLGTLVSSSKIGGTTFYNNISVSGNTGRSNELILKQNSTYLKQFISGTDSNIINFKASWYEESGG